jgi:hypothetical protein
MKTINPLVFKQFSSIVDNHMSFIDEKTQTDNKNINLFLSMEIYDLSKILKFNETARKALAVAILYDTEDCTAFQMHSAEIISSLVRLFIETLKSVYANIDELYDEKVNEFVNFLQTTVDEIYN